MNPGRRLAHPRPDSESIVKEARRLLASRIEEPSRRAFLSRTLTLGGVALLSGCSMGDNDGVERALSAISRWNDRVQAWIFDPSVHGQGIAFEACSAALRWAEDAIRADSYPAIIDLENTASMKLAQRLDFVRVGDAVYRDEPIAFFRRPGRL